MTTIMKWFFRILPLGYIGLIWIQSQLFNPDSVEASPRIGYMLEMGHLFLFGILYILITLAFITYGKWSLKTEVLVLVLTLFFALGDEFHQYYVPYRSASSLDMVKNTIGILAAWCLVLMARKSIKHKQVKKL